MTVASDAGPQSRGFSLIGCLVSDDDARIADMNDDQAVDTQADVVDEEAAHASIRSELSDGILTITLDRAAKGNALRPSDRRQVIALLQSAHETAAVRCVVLRAAGRHFCTGADVTGLRRTDAETVVGEVSRRIMGGAQQLIAAVLDCDKPVIAVVQGAAAGMGAHLALAADFVIATEEAVFIESFVLRGITVDAVGAYLLTRHLGMRKAKELALLGDRLPAEDALRLGLVNWVVSGDDLASTVSALATRLAAASTTALALTKRLFNVALDQDRASSFAFEGLMQEAQSHSIDSTEGVAAFLENRAPVFRGV